MFTKLLLCCAVAAILGIASVSSADTYEIIQIDPRQFNQQHQNGQCQQYMKYYDNFYNQEYKKYYDKYYNDYYYNYWNNYWKNHYANKAQVPQIPNVDLGNAEIEWVCTNPKTKDQWIIGSEQVVSNGNGQQSQIPPNFPIKDFPPLQGQGGHYQPPQYYPPQQGGHQQGGHHHGPPNYQPGHQYPPPNYQPGHQYPPPNQYPQYSTPSFPTSQPNYPTQNHQETPKTTPAPTTEAINTNGEGIIDIRFGDGDD